MAPRIAQTNPKMSPRRLNTAPRIPEIIAALRQSAREVGDSKGIVNGAFGAVAGHTRWAFGGEHLWALARTLHGWRRDVHVTGSRL
jgi:hypothetical protein